MVASVIFTPGGAEVDNGAAGAAAGAGEVDAADQVVGEAVAGATQIVAVAGKTSPGKKSPLQRLYAPFGGDLAHLQVTPAVTR